MWDYRNEKLCFALQQVKIRYFLSTSVNINWFDPLLSLVVHSIWKINHYIARKENRTLTFFLLKENTGGEELIAGTSLRRSFTYLKVRPDKRRAPPKVTVRHNLKLLLTNNSIVFDGNADLTSVARYAIRSTNRFDMYKILTRHSDGPLPVTQRIPVKFYFFLLFQANCLLVGPSLAKFEKLTNSPTSTPRAYDPISPYGLEVRLPHRVHVRLITYGSHTSSNLLLFIFPTSESNLIH